MEIILDRNVVEFKKVIVDCMKENKKLAPIGEYIPAEENLARFVIEGIPGGKTEWSEQKAAADSAYYCAVCNKYMNVKAGGDVPLCCGRNMEPMD